MCLTRVQIRKRSRLSFHNTYSFLKKIDQLPTGPDWICDIVNLVGDRKGEDGQMMGEELELWRRNPIQCVQELIGNPALKDDMSYEPAQVFTDRDRTNRLIDEAWTADWWWKTQVTILVVDVAVMTHQRFPGKDTRRGCSSAHNPGI